MQLADGVNLLNGVGKAMAKLLNRLGIETVGNLIHYYPRRYNDFSIITPIKYLKPGTVTVKGNITKAQTRYSRRGLSITEAILDDSTGQVKCVWFNQPYLAKTLPKSQSVFVSGRLEYSYNQYAFQTPVVEKVSNFPKHTARIVPVYRESKDVSSAKIRSLLKQVLPLIKKLDETLPSVIVDDQKLMPYNRAVAEIHFPSSPDALGEAKYRLAFEELFYLILAALVIKQEIRTEDSNVIRFDETSARNFVSQLPFKLTDAQRKAAWQILQDLARQKPMNRLLEGDVGSGKTVVAAMASLMTVNNGFQVAFMAPTEVLAKQHHNTLRQLLKNFDIRIKLLVGGANTKSKATTLEQISGDKADIIIGTHALLEPTVVFNQLGLVIIDEQHRFGVNQRVLLKGKGKAFPHLLSMSATPIPRSLALTVYGDLDISIIDQMPTNRKPVKTKVAAAGERERIYTHIDREIDKGRQVYVVCPLISESDKLGAKSVEVEFERLRQSVFKHHKIGLLHGRLPAKEKDRIMQWFKEGKYNILVSTTVVEVGVDVPNATVMLIEGAERFGLAQLHQLRGRVGRSIFQSHCYLLTSENKPIGARLRLLEQSNNGFVLAQKDLEFRGPGEIYGRRQHGLLDLRFAKITDTRLISEVRQAAEKFLKGTPNLIQYPQLLERVNQLKKLTTLD